MDHAPDLVISELLPPNFSQRSSRNTLNHMESVFNECKFSSVRIIRSISQTGTVCETFNSRQCRIKLVGDPGAYLVLWGPFDGHSNIIIYLFHNNCFKDALFGDRNLKRSPIPFV